MNELFIIFHILLTPFYEIKQQLLICCLNKRKKHRINRLQMFYKTRVKNFANSQKNTYVRTSLLIKVFKKRLGRKCFPVNFVKFCEIFRTPYFLSNTSSVSENSKSVSRFVVQYQQFSLFYSSFHLFKQQYTKLQQYTASKNCSRFSVRYLRHY